MELADESHVTLSDRSERTVELDGLGQDTDGASWVMVRSGNGHGQFCFFPGLAACLGSAGT